MNDAHTDALPHLAELFLHVVLFVLPRDIFDSDRRALLRLARVRKSFVEDMQLCSGGFSLDLHMSAKHIVMMSPYPRCHLAFFDRAQFEALKRTASRFQSIGSLCINLEDLPVGCNFINTAQILDLVFHCLRTGRAKHLHISHAIFQAEQFTSSMRHLFPSTKNQILSLHLSHCKLAINSQFLRELASMRNLRNLTLDGNAFQLRHAAFPGFSDKLEYLSVAGCSGVWAALLKNVSKTLRSLVCNDSVILHEDKPLFLAWIADSCLRTLDMDNCGFYAQDIENFQAAFARMPCLLSLSIARNDCFEDTMLWWIYEYWRQGTIPCFFSVHVSNMHVCFPDHGSPVFMSSMRFGQIEIHEF